MQKAFKKLTGIVLSVLGSFGVSVSRIFSSEIADFSPIFRQIRQLLSPRSRKIRQFLAIYSGKLTPYPQNFEFYCIFML